MPFDENGVKWSCEPCIRGHRSSKCAHFDRLMVSVGKAGRPLSKCPHVEGSCNCKKLGAFMVAIPKGSSCLCRPVYKMLLDENGPTPAVAQLPLDTTTTTSSAGTASPSPSKIQKPIKKQIKTPPEQVTRALHSIPEYHQQALQFGFPPTMNPYTQVHSSGNVYSPVAGTMPLPGVFPAATNFSGQMGLPSNELANGTYQMNVIQPALQVEAPMPTQTRGSCCSNSRRESPDSIKTGLGIVAPNGYAISPVTASPVAEASSSAWPGFSSIDGYFSSVNGPINGYQPDLSGFSQQIPPIGYADPASIDFAQNQIPHPEPVAAPSSAHHNLTAHTSGTHQNCNCGPKCNCFACPDHPYNEVTMQHVQEMGRIIAKDQTLAAEDSQQTIQTDGLAQMSSPIVEPKTKLEDTHDLTPAAGPCCGGKDVQFDVEHDVQPPVSISADNLMVPDAYYTYEYEIGLPGACAGEAGNCQCGPDCSCLGCLTHGNA
ncbi:putative copper-activated transcription factor GRISEA [Aspergillus undulatus]|uniref:putative copper-activated transcription factor GRISEA n=1 Tax=Aspergillus undulatus TaxID=1810928 RepID=UPI003CCE3F25